MSTWTLVSIVALAAAPGWRAQRPIEGITVELRDVVDSSFEEIRVTTTSPLKLTSLCDAVWAKGLSGKAPEGNFKKRVVIRETEDERWTYEQIKVPVVSDRDYVMHVKLVQPASTGRCEVQFETRTDPAYPPVKDHVRIAAVRGSWELVPTADGKTKISYVVYSDPGGTVPALFTRGGQRDAAIDFLKVILARAAPRS